MSASIVRQRELQENWQRTNRMHQISWIKHNFSRREFKGLSNAWKIIGSSSLGLKRVWGFITHCRISQNEPTDQTSAVISNAPPLTLKVSNYSTIPPKLLGHLLRVKEAKSVPTSPKQVHKITIFINNNLHPQSWHYNWLKIPIFRIDTDNDFKTTIQRRLILSRTPA